MYCTVQKLQKQKLIQYSSKGFTTLGIYLKLWAINVHSQHQYECFSGLFATLQQRTLYTHVKKASKYILNKFQTLNMLNILKQSTI